MKKELNSKIWDKNNKINKNIANRIFEIVEYFKENLPIDLDIIDILIVGSQASFNYTDTSDLDVHIITNFDFIPAPKELVQAYFNAEKTNFNKKFDISLHKIPVELYVDDVNSSVLSNGIYSLIDDEWIKYPQEIVSEYNTDSPSVIRIAKKLIEAINHSIDENNLENLKNLLDNIYLMRRNSLSVDGEYGQGNLVFKKVRAEGYLDKLKDAIDKKISINLTLENFPKGMFVNRFTD